MTMTDPTILDRQEAPADDARPGDFVRYAHHGAGFYVGTVTEATPDELVIEDTVYGEHRSPRHLIDPATFRIATHYAYPDWPDAPPLGDTPRLVFPGVELPHAFVPFSDAAMAFGIAGRRRDLVVYRGEPGRFGADLIVAGIRARRCFTPGELGFHVLDRGSDHAAEIIAASIAGPLRPLFR